MSLLNWLGELGRRVAMLLRRGQFDRDLDEEMRLHREFRERQHRVAGSTPGEAHYAAERRFGNATIYKERSRDMWGWNWLEHLAQDVRYGLRVLRMSPGFTLVAALSLALGIGANTAIFQLMDVVMLRALPVSKPEELADVRIINMDYTVGQYNGRHAVLSHPMWQQIRKNQQAFAQAFAWATDTFDLAANGESRFAEGGLMVSGNFFTALGVAPLHGRVFTDADDYRGCTTPGAVVSHAFWLREFGGDPAAVGRKITLDGQPFEVVGVTPPEFFGMEVGRRYDVAVPICAEEILNGENQRLDRRWSWWLLVMGRLKPGWTMERATQHLTAISPGMLQETLPTDNYDAAEQKHYLGFKLGAFPVANGVSNLRRNYDRALWLLLGITGLVLLIACANLANLMLARASAREREIAVRMAMGASRGRVVRQFLTESLMLAATGAALGAVLAPVASRALVAMLSTAVSPAFLELDRDWRVFGFAAALAIVTCALFGLGPALRATRLAPAAAMKSGGRSATAGRERFGLRRLLVVSQVAMSLVLLVGALLFVRSLRNLTTMDTGFQQQGILQIDADLRKSNTPHAQRYAYKQQFLERLRAMPGAQAVASTSNVPLSGSTWNQHVHAELGGEKRKELSYFARISEGYFHTIQTPILAGRDFAATDVLGGLNVAIVNETFARKLFAGANPVGRKFQYEDGPNNHLGTYEIVGLVRDTKYRRLRDEPTPITYLPASQEERPGLFQAFLVRTSAPLSDTMANVRRTTAEFNPNVAYHFHIVQEEIRNTLLRERLMATLSGSFGVLAGLLAAIGLYGVISYMVVRRTNEIGIRMALGAQRANILRMILGDAGRMLTLGLLIGIGLSLALARTAEAMLFGLKPNDPLTVAMAVALLAAVATLASYWPAHRAARVDPMVALREE